MIKASFVLLLFTICMHADALKTVSSYKNAIHKAEKEHKLVLVMMSFSGCPLCDYMKDIVMERPRVLDYLNKHFFVVTRDLLKDRYPQRFSVIDTPTFFFIDPKTKKEVIPKRSGGFRPDAFLALLHEATGEPMPQPEPKAENNTTDNNATLTPCRKNVPCEASRKITIN
ncbi:MAG TPA: DUF255 domain-containing protein [Campylobacteraceae bacterium]|nr:DUF255 domain-containing protein [Campylobacteraceae bacterium]